MKQALESTRRRLWFVPRGSIDISWGFWLVALCEIVRSAVTSVTQRSERTLHPSPNEETLAVLSARSGLDALLRSQNFPPGSEAIVSAVNIPDMFSILQHHDLQLVSIDIDSATLRIDEAELVECLNENTRIILIAQLFGVREDYHFLEDVPHRGQIIVIEDVAQAFDGSEPRCPSWADASIYSFGPIKTATVLGGGLLGAHNGALLQQAERAMAEDPTQSSLRYGRRILWYGMLKCLEWPRAYALFIKGCRLLNCDADDLISSATHSFPKNELLRRIRTRPCVALRRMLVRRFAHNHREMIVRRQELARQLADSLQEHGYEVVGQSCESMTYWAFGVLEKDPESLIQHLRQAGFDATQRASSLRTCIGQRALLDESNAGAEQHSKGNESLGASRLCHEIVYLPLPALRHRSDTNRLVSVLRDYRSGKGVRHQ